MRTTVTVEDKLFNTAKAFLGEETPAADVFRVALETFVRVESAKRLAALGGVAPDAVDVPRRVPGNIAP